MKRCVLAIDQGTTGSTALVVSEDLQVLGRANVEFPQSYPRPGWVEHDPEAIWKSITTAIEQAVGKSGVAPASIAAIGVTNQRETVLLWDRKTGEPARPAIVWQDRRTQDICAALKEKGHEPEVRKRTGLVLDPYFSGTKLTWIFQDAPSLHARAQSGALAAGTVDSFVVYRLTGGKQHVTEPSNASRTLLFGLESLKWEDDLLRLFRVPPACLPEVRSSSEVYGVTKGVPGLPDGIPVAGMAGDQQAALFGQACFSPGEAKCTYGTGSFLLMNTGDRPVASTHGLLTTVGWKLGTGTEAGEVAYALEGSCFIAGAAVQWLRDELGLFKSSSEVEDLARSVPDSGGVMVIPAFAGLGAPHWRPEARGAIFGLTRGSGKAHIARAVLEGIALQHFDLVEAMDKDSGVSLKVLRVDGGAAANDLLMQFQSDVLGVAISRPEVIETTGMGAAFLAGLGAGVWASKHDIARAWREERRFTPAKNREAVDAKLARWRELVAKV